MNTCKRIFKLLGIVLVLLLLGPFWIAVTDYPLNQEANTYQKFSPEQVENEACICLYGARAGRWQKSFSLHTWITCKRKNEKEFTLYQIVRDRDPATGGYLQTIYATPQLSWCGFPALLLFCKTGEEAERLIPEIEKAIADYPYKDTYHVWPGPNCNTFTAYIGRQVFSLRMALPPHAVGKDFLMGWRLFDKAPSGTGYQISLGGLVTILVAREEGFECSILGLNFGFHPWKPAWILPGFGYVY